MAFVSRRGFVGTSLSGIVVLTGSTKLAYAQSSSDSRLTAPLTSELLRIVQRAKVGGFRAEHAMHASSLIRLIAADLEATGIDSAVRDAIRSQVDRYGIDYFSKQPADVGHAVGQMERKYGVDLSEVAAALSSPSRSATPADRRRETYRALEETTTTGNLRRVAELLEASAGRLALRERRGGVTNAQSSGTCDGMWAAFYAMEAILPYVCAGFPLACDILILTMFTMLASIYLSGC